MKIVVQKYGGTSMANPAQILCSAQKVLRVKQHGYSMVVVVSAMSGETDRLLNLGNHVNPDASLREIDMLCSTGEQVSIALMAMALEKLGQPAISLTGQQVGILTDDVHTKARIKSIATDRIINQLKQNKVVIVAGFQGVTDKNDITTLGRGGSDTSAVALAHALNAVRCEIYTDVTGVFTADPRIAPNAKQIDMIDYDEMLEMAGSGAKVLQIRSVEFAKKYNVPVLVLSSMEDKPGTLVTSEVPEMEGIVVSAITHNKKEAKISIIGVPDKPGIAATIFGILAEHEIVVDIIIQNVAEDGLNDISFTVNKDDLRQVQKLSDEIKKKVNAQAVISDENISKISIIGVGMKSHAGVASRMFKALAEEKINIQMISTSEIKVSCVIEEADTEKAVLALCKEFDLLVSNVNKEEPIKVKSRKKSKKNL